MKTDKATVTIPYDEFAKHQEQVKEIEWAREIKRKMDNGDLMDFNTVAKQVLAMGEYIAMTPDSRPYFEDFARQKGFSCLLSTVPGTNIKAYTLRKIEK